MDKKGVQQRIEMLRKEKGWSKMELSRRSGLHYQHLVKILGNGVERGITLESAVRLADAFNVPLDDLAGRS